MIDSNKKIILEKEKDNFTFTRIKKNEYQVSFTIQNNFIDLPSIMNFDLLKLLYDLNKDIFAIFTLDKINEKEAISLLLFNHFFVDLGLSQKYAYFHIEKKEVNDLIEFYSKTIFAEKPEIIPGEASLISFQDINISIQIETAHKVNISGSILLEEKHNQDIPLFIEKFISQIIYKIINRLKQFIENNTSNI
jgi:hypothetical protein